MSKKIVVTDTHLGRKSGNELELSITLQFFEWLSQIAQKREIYTLIHLGDFHNSRRNLTIPTIYTSINIIKQISKVFDQSYILAGNHDIYFKDRMEPNSINFLKRKNINIVTNPLKIDNMILMPWIVDNTHLQNIISNDYNVDYLLGHLPINEVIMNRSNIMSQNEILNIKDFSCYKKVLSGHFHQYGEYKNIIYIGAPYHMDFNDSGKRGIYIFDDEDGFLEFIEYENAPKYYNIDAEHFDESIINGNNIKLIFYNDLGINKINQIIKNIEDLKPNWYNTAYKFTDKFTKQKGFDKISEIAGNKQILIDYITNSDIPPNININLMKKIIDKLEKK